MLIVMLVLLLVALGAAELKHRQWGYVGWSPAGIILGLVLVMWISGALHL